MENPQIPHATSYTARLDRTLQALQDRVKEQEAILEQLRATTSKHPISHLRQTRSLSATYGVLILQDPFLPSPDSPLPALLALRSTQDCIVETEVCIAKTELDLRKTQKRLEEKQSDLKDAKLVQADIDTRTLLLQDEMQERSQRTPSQITRELIRDMNTKKVHYDRGTGKLVKSFNVFVDEHLAPMLTAEELGGPIVGEIMDVDEEMLEAGFNAYGKSERAKNSVGDDKRQRRINEMWDSGQSRKAREPWNENHAAATEMRGLTEQLLNSLVEAEGDGPGAYVELGRDSAAARFLVRSKIAQFHPKDARRLRLIDFGGELED